MGLNKPLILDTQYAYNVAVGEARWREDYATWEMEADYREEVYQNELTAAADEQRYRDELTARAQFEIEERRRYNMDTYESNVAAAEEQRRFRQEQYDAGMMDAAERRRFQEERYEVEVAGTEEARRYQADKLARDKEYVRRDNAQKEAIYQRDRVYREKQIAYQKEKFEYDTARETERFEHDTAVAKLGVQVKHQQGMEIKITARKEFVQAAQAVETERLKTAETMSVNKLNAGAFASGRSLQTMLRQIGHEGTEKASKIFLASELHQSIRNQQLEGLNADAEKIVGSVRGKVEQMHALAPPELVAPMVTMDPIEPQEIQDVVAPRQVFDPTRPQETQVQVVPQDIADAVERTEVQGPLAPIDYRAPIYVRPLEPNLEGFPEGAMNEDVYIGASPEDTGPTPPPAYGSEDWLADMKERFPGGMPSFNFGAGGGGSYGNTTPWDVWEAQQAGETETETTTPPAEETTTPGVTPPFTPGASYGTGFSFNLTPDQLAAFTEARKLENDIQ